MPDIEFFKTRTDQFTEKAHSLKKKFHLISVVRVAVFIIGLLLTIYFANERNAWGIFFSLFPAIIIFFLIVKYHNKIRNRMIKTENLALINEWEINRIKGNLGGFDQGDEFMDEDHSYTSDLDIFGKNSLFQLINRTVTLPGRRLLASWLQSPASKEEILTRQKAVTELKEQVDWRQEFQASAMQSSNKGTDYNAFEIWLNEPSRIQDYKILRVLSFLLPLITTASIVGVILNFWSYPVVILVLISNGVVLSRTLKIAGETTDKAGKCLQSILAFHSLIVKVESHSFQSEYLQNIQNSLKKGQTKASGEIGRLSRIMQKFDSRSNVLFFILDLFFLLDIHWLMEAELWRSGNKRNVNSWINSISKLEAVSSLSGTFYTHEHYCLPEIQDSYDLVLKQTGHPLINTAERIYNDFSMGGLGSEIIITGSNMSGKSTFLRTLGINLVMAYTGGPVCSGSARIPIMNVYTSMRTHDDLEEHISSFYAELKRIQGLLHLFEYSQIPVFYLLDEILKGTNSDDRHLGAESLVIQLLSQPGMGLISTHDLALSSLEKKYDQVKNYSFNSVISGSEIIFDYRITRGVCKGFNASKLMEKMGIVLQNNKNQKQ